jgi:hypothetical protein
MRQKRAERPASKTTEALKTGAGCKPGCASEEAFKYGTRLNMPYMIGVYLAVNATSDAYIVVDGPDCSFFKGEYVFMKHDWCSGLFRTDGRHRILFTATNAQNATNNRENVIRRTILTAASQPDARLVLLSYMPLGCVTGTQYDRILGSITSEVPLAEVPGRSMSGDWLDGYAAALKSIVGASKLNKRKRDPGKVAVVGHLMDRNEGDQRGNIRELKRLLRGIGLKPSLVWPGGEGFRSLAAAEGAGTIISLPYGREAASMTAEMSGARLLETDLPFGLDGTCRWIERIGSFFGIEKKAGRFIDAELDRIVPLMTRLLPFYFLNCTASLTCDPFMLRGFLDIFENLGMRASQVVVASNSSHVDRMAEKFKIPEGVLFEPFLTDIKDRSTGRGVKEKIPPDLIITSSRHEGKSPDSIPVMEIGFPSFHHHALTDTPFLGFNGVLHVAERIANTRSAIS